MGKTIEITVDVDSDGLIDALENEQLADSYEMADKISVQNMFDSLAGRGQINDFLEKCDTPDLVSSDKLSKELLYEMGGSFIANWMSEDKMFDEVVSDYGVDGVVEWLNENHPETTSTPLNKRSARDLIEELKYRRDEKSDFDNQWLMDALEVKTATGLSNIPLSALLEEVQRRIDLMQGSVNTLKTLANESAG